MKIEDKLCLSMCILHFKPIIIVNKKKYTSKKQDFNFFLFGTKHFYFMKLKTFLFTLNPRTNRFDLKRDEIKCKMIKPFINYNP